MLWWLQELQYGRRIYNVEHVKTNIFNQDTNHDEDLIDLVEPPDNSGLLTNGANDKRPVEGNYYIRTIYCDLL